MLRINSQAQPGYSTIVVFVVGVIVRFCLGFRSLLSWSSFVVVVVLFRCCQLVVFFVCSTMFELCEQERKSFSAQWTFAVSSLFVGLYLHCQYCQYLLSVFSHCQYLLYLDLPCRQTAVTATNKSLGNGQDSKWWRGWSSVTEKMCFSSPDVFCLVWLDFVWVWCYCWRVNWLFICCIVMCQLFGRRWLGQAERWGDLTEMEEQWERGGLGGCSQSDISCFNGISVT